jgi:hypothetical protein
MIAPTLILMVLKETSPIPSHRLTESASCKHCPTLNVREISFMNISCPTLHTVFIKDHSEFLATRIIYGKSELFIPTFRVILSWQPDHEYDL